MLSGNQIFTDHLKEILTQKKEDFINHFETDPAIHQLRGANIISEEQYAQILQVVRTKKRRLVYDILMQQSGNAWVEDFKRILRDTDQTWLISDQESQYRG